MGGRRRSESTSETERSECASAIERVSERVSQSAGKKGRESVEAREGQSVCMCERERKRVRRSSAPYWLPAVPRHARMPAGWPASDAVRDSDRRRRRSVEKTRLSSDRSRILF